MVCIILFWGSLEAEAGGGSSRRSGSAIANASGTVAVAAAAVVVVVSGGGVVVVVPNDSDTNIGTLICGYWYTITNMCRINAVIPTHLHTKRRNCEVMYDQTNICWYACFVAILILYNYTIIIIYSFLAYKDTDLWHTKILIYDFAHIPI